MSKGEGVNVSYKTARPIGNAWESRMLFCHEKGRLSWVRLDQSPTHHLPHSSTLKGHMAHPHDASPVISAEDALRRLNEGNERFRRGEAREIGLSREQMAEMSKGQRPFATIIGCSDSRVAPEWIFDAALGELFVIRVAGNVMSAEVAGSMQYAGSHLHTPLFVVLGHEGCGAVDAALATRDHDAKHAWRIQILADAIVPGLPEFEAGLSKEQRLSAAVEANVRWTVKQIRETPEARARAEEGVIKLVGAIYEIESGEVRWLQ
jgi:carbonic anhydrase